MDAIAARCTALHLRLRNGSIWIRLLAVLAGTAILALSSYIEVPMVPVPLTMQTFAVTLIGAFYGWRLGAATVVAWLVEGALGAPVFAGGFGGLAYFAGQTGGYLLSFPIAAGLVGWLVERGWNGRHPLLAFAAMLLGNAVSLALGAEWLAVYIGTQKALMLGVMPFVLGGIVKSALGAATLRALVR
jgi:biotin transport system substrate-specific component